MEHRCAFVCASRKLHGESSTFNFTAHRDCFGLINDLLRVIADELDLLRVKIDVLVHDHDIALSFAIFKVRRGVHRNIDHAFRNLFVQFFRNFFRAEIVPAALDSAGVVDNSGFAACKRRICGLMQ